MKITVSRIKQNAHQGNAIILGVFKGEKINKALKKVSEEAFISLEKAQKSGKIEGGFQSFFKSYGEYGAASEVIVIGLGDKKSYRALCLRKAIASLARSLSASKIKKSIILGDSFVGGEIQKENVVELFTEGPLLALYQFKAYKSGSKKGEKPCPESGAILFDSAVNARKFNTLIERTEKIRNAILFARDLNNHPANIMNPPRLAKDVQAMAKKVKLRCQVLGLSEIKKEKMGGVLGVNQGSVTPPQFIIMEHGKSHAKKGTICLVGKGVTFDTGGISIKPSKGMEDMKYDKSGAIAVIGAMRAIADLKLPVHVIGITPAVENNVANDPIRPGDILNMHSGKTVEVLNTDAEGRLILADALSYSAKFKPKAIVDLATLTGMCVYTFGDKTCGMLGNDEKLMEKFYAASNRCGERVWQLPLWDEYSEQIKGNHADLQNIGGPYGGTITAAAFLKEFVPADTPWVHLDIAGTAWATGNRWDCQKGATGFGVKLLTDFVTHWKK